MATGTVKWFDGEKGYGFITQEDGTDLFAHHASTGGQGGFQGLVGGERVEFECPRGQKELEAVGVQRVFPKSA